MNIKQGDRIELKPEWLDSGEENTNYVAAEDLAPGADSLYMLCPDCTMFINPTNLIRLHMIKAVNGVPVSC